MKHQLEHGHAVKCDSIEQRERIFKVADECGVEVYEVTRTNEFFEVNPDLYFVENTGIMGIKNNHELSIYIPESEFISRMRREWQSVEPEKVEQPIDPMRFQAACAAMQGYISGVIASGSFPSAKEAAAEAIFYADALICALKGGAK